jgi:hypothetical protein
MLRTAALAIGAVAAVGGLVTWAASGVALIGIAGLLAGLAAVAVQARGLPVDGWSAPDPTRAGQNGSGRLSRVQRPRRTE